MAFLSSYSAMKITCAAFCVVSYNRDEVKSQTLPVGLDAGTIYELVNKKASICCPLAYLSGQGTGCRGYNFLFVSHRILISSIHSLS
jgi:hypothetical protein